MSERPRPDKKEKRGKIYSETLIWCSRKVLLIFIEKSDCSKIFRFPWVDSDKGHKLLIGNNVPIKWTTGANI